MRVFLFSTHSLWSHHNETELEIMQGHINADDEVFRFVCNSYFATCDVNVEHTLIDCCRCIDKQRLGQKLLNENEKIVVKPVYKNEHYKKSLICNFNFENVEQLKAFKVENFDIGYAVCSSVISALRDPQPDIKLYESLYKRFFYSSLAVYYAACDYINEFKPDLVYAFNGRVAHAKPILRAAQLKNVECRIHERGCDSNHYSINVNTTPHDISNFNKLMMLKWNESTSPEREIIGAQFFEERVKGKEQGWVSFIKEQQSDLLPKDWNPSKRNIAIFNTSEDEYESIGVEWKNTLFSNQAEGIDKILHAFLQKPEFHFYLRIHPNLSGLNNRQIRDAYALSFYSNLTIIDAESPISTYALMNNCEKTLTFGSSAGIEATYWGKVSVLLGKSFYYNLDVAYQPNTLSEAVEMLIEILPPKSIAGTLKYGYYFKTFGIKFKYYKPVGFHRGTFKNADIDLMTSSRTRLYRKLSRIKNLQDVLRENKGNRLSALKNFLFKW